MNTKKRVFNKLAEETKVELATQKVELGTSKMVDNLFSKYKSLGKYDVGKYISSINKITNQLKQGVDKNGDLLAEAKDVQRKYDSIGDKENAGAIQRLINDLQNDFDEVVFLYEGLRKL